MLERVVIVLAVVAAAALAYWWWSRREGAVTAVTSSTHLTSLDVGAPLGVHATLLQFSSPMCSKCPGTARLLSSVAGEDPRIVHAEVDATERLDLARRLDIMRTPTTLVLDGTGAVVARMSGAVQESQVREALATVPLTGTDYSI